ncbi:hypothetical protein [Campylobacter rectus]|uniref:hypothetical protein n=1 Tax=Campylobacter rectus TaxID=203 RepID=UPI0023F32620|nr:hypothetical protein [Campylobacter rectus]
MKTSVCADKAKIKLAQPSATKRQAREMPSSQGFYGYLKDTKILKRPQDIEIKATKTKDANFAKTR